MSPRMIPTRHQARPETCGRCAGDGGNNAAAQDAAPSALRRAAARAIWENAAVMRKAVFPEKPAIRPLEGSDYELGQKFVFHATVACAWDVEVRVKPGFRTDGASIPRLLWRVFGSPYDPDIFAAAIGHDALYRGEIVPRRDADAAFLYMMAKHGVRKRRRRLIWLGVRLFGWITWLSHTPESVAEARRYISLAFAGAPHTPNNE